MITKLVVASLCFLALCAIVQAENKDTRVYEMRTYYAPPGKLEELHARFRNHTVKLFEKHGMTNVGYWVPSDKEKGSENTLIYILSYPSREAGQKSWAAFMKDPEWLAAWKESEKNGKLVEKVESVYMTSVDYSPEIKANEFGKDTTFELRVYTTPPGKLADLNKRFRDHTVNLFSKHGMKHVGYWVPMDAKNGADTKLIYFLAHKDKAAAAASFNSFRVDPDWVKARAESEKDGSLTVPNGVQSTFMKATDYSRIK